jgi:hypothetical protein
VGEAVRAVVAIVAVLVAAGCGSGDSAPAAEETLIPQPTVTQQETPSTASATPTPELETQAPVETSERGNVVKEVGEIGGLAAEETGTLDDAWITFTVTDIKADAECTSGFSDPPENGHFNIVSMSIETAPVSDWPTEMQGFPLLFYDNWSIVGHDGITENAINSLATATCLPESEILPYNGMGPGERIVGKLALDSRNTSGVLIWAPFGSGGGWEWEF